MQMQITVGVDDWTVISLHAIVDHLKGFTIHFKKAIKIWGSCML